MAEGVHVIIDEIFNKAKLVDRAGSSLSDDTKRELISACLQAVHEVIAKNARIKEEQSIDGPWAMQDHSERG